MSKYVNAKNFITSPYGKDYAPGLPGALFVDNKNVEEFLTFISSLIDLHCGRTFDVATYTQEFSGDTSGQSVVFVDVIPVTAVSGIVQYPTFDMASQSTINPTLYRWDRYGKIRFLNGLTPDYDYFVTYSAGYTPDKYPAPIVLATMMLANVFLQAVDNGAVAFPDGGTVTSFRFGKFQEAYADWRFKNKESAEGIPQSVANILGKFRYSKQ